MRTISLASLAVLISGSLLAQSFEVTSVKASPPPPNGLWNYNLSGGPGTKDPTRFTCQNFDLASLIQMVYDVPYYLLLTPAWTRDQRFDIVAKIPEGATKEQFLLMQQNLLAERFKLVVHREKKEMPLYELVVAKGGVKFKETGKPRDETDGPLFPGT
jgi:uncharacterized protein (TIGR03435 family)